jgi:hypothetical protein
MAAAWKGALIKSRNSRNGPNGTFAFLARARRTSAAAAERLSVVSYALAD